jgi:hypothetical protein
VLENRFFLWVSNFFFARSSPIHVLVEGLLWVCCHGIVGVKVHFPFISAKPRMALDKGNKTGVPVWNKIMQSVWIYMFFLLSQVLMLVKFSLLRNSNPRSPP